MKISNRILKIGLFLSICLVFIGCRQPSAKTILERLGFSPSTIIVASLDNNATSTNALVSKPISQEQIGKLWASLDEAQPSKTAVVFPKYRINIFTGSSLPSQKLEIFMDETGEFYMKRGDSSETYFFYDNSLYTFASHYFQ